MLRILCALLIALTVGPIFAADAPTDVKQVAIIHFDQLKNGKLEGTAKDITFKPITGGPNRTSYIGLRNELYTPREITVKILGLKEGDYDLYIDANLVGVKKSSELESGIQVSLPGSDIPQAYRDYYTMLKTRCLANVGLFEKATDRDGSKCKAIIQAIADWVRSIEQGDNLIRTVGIIVVPKGQPLSLPGGRYILERPKDFKKSVLHLADAIHTIRGAVINEVQNKMLQNDTLTIITPLDFKLTTSAAVTPGSKITVTAALTNWTDRNATGKIQLGVPSDWTVKDVTSEVTMPGYSKTAEVKFEVTIPNTADANTKVTATADLTVGNIPLKLSQTVDNQ